MLQEPSTCWGREKEVYSLTPSQSSTSASYFCCANGMRGFWFVKRCSIRDSVAAGFNKYVCTWNAASTRLN